MSKNLKKFFAMTLAVIMVLAMLPTGVFAADADLKISTAAQLKAFADVAGETVTYMEPEAVKVATYDELVAALANGGEIKLTADITTTAALTTSGVTANIDLNGYTLTIGAGDNKFNDASNITISNGKIDITGVSFKGNAIFCLDENEKTLVTTLTLNDVDLTGNGYSSAYGVFYIGSSSVLNVNGGQWNLSNDTHGSGGVFKADAAEATLNIDGLELNAHNVRRVVTYAATTINNSTLTITGDADGVDAEMEHGFNRSPLTITNSTITMKDMVGRGITAEKGAVTINNSTVTIENVQEATIEVRGGQTVTVSADSTVSVDAEPTISNGTIQGTVQIPSNDAVAYNKETGKLYNDLVAGLREAEANETVVLLRDVTVREVSVYEDITLDLDGHNLTATYVNVYGNLVDNSQSNAGRLVVSESKMMFRNNNAQVPVKTETGYAFVEIVKFNAAFDKTGKFHFQPVFEAYGCELLKNGTTGTGVSIQVALSWKVGSETRTQYVQYNDTLVQAFFASYNASTGKYGKDFTLMISNAADFQDLTYTVCVVAGTVVCSNA